MCPVYLLPMWPVHTPDYGEKVISLNEKIAAVQLQLEEGSARIVFNAKSETCNIVVVS